MTFLRRNTYLIEFVAGIRVSLYNAVTEADTDKLVGYMKKFVSEASPQAPV
jgi:phosphoserine aminotransferase